MMLNIACNSIATSSYNISPFLATFGACLPPLGAAGARWSCLSDVRLSEKVRMTTFEAKLGTQRQKCKKVLKNRFWLDNFANWTILSIWYFGLTKKFLDHSKVLFWGFWLSLDPIFLRIRIFLDLWFPQRCSTDSVVTFQRISQNSLERFSIKPHSKMQYRVILAFMAIFRAYILENQLFPRRLVSTGL